MDFFKWLSDSATTLFSSHKESEAEESQESQSENSKRDEAGKTESELEIGLQAVSEEEIGPIGSEFCDGCRPSVMTVGLLCLLLVFCDDCRPSVMTVGLL